MTAGTSLSPGLMPPPEPPADCLPAQRCSMATVVNLGLPRTGSTSLHAAMQTLGLRSLHAADSSPAALAALARAALSGAGLQAPLRHGLMCHDAVGGAPWFALAPQALSPSAAPRLKLVATTRDRASWLPSARWLFTDPLFAAHPEPVLELMRRTFRSPRPFERAPFARAFDRHAAMLQSLNATLIDLRAPPRLRWRALCSVLLAPPRCATPVLRSMRDCPEGLPWPHRSERGNHVELFGISRAQAAAIDLDRDPDAGVDDALSAERLLEDGDVHALLPRSA